MVEGILLELYRLEHCLILLPKYIQILEKLLVQSLEILLQIFLLDFQYTAELNKMGANIVGEGTSVIIVNPTLNLKKVNKNS